tara:strand:+ start:32369 stop:32833 length:465 start_codon:yes stop_codon:yes gene_type:complete
MKKKILSVLLSFIIVMLPIAVKAQEVEDLEGQIIPIDKNEKAPFSGILLDTIAASKITIDKKYTLLESKLKLDFELKKLTSEFQFKLDTLQISHDSLKMKTDSIINIKDGEIHRLQELIKDDPNDYTHWWFSGGVAIGIIVSIGIFFAAVEVAK